MICPACATPKTRVYGTKSGLTTTRFRVCEACGCKFMTREVLKEDLLSHSYNEYLVEIGELEADIRKKALKET